MPTHACSCAREFLRLAGVCALRLPTTSSAEVPAAETHNIKRASPDALGQHGRRNTDQKDQLYFASRSIRQWRGQASLTDVNRVSNSCLRRKSPTQKHLEYARPHVTSVTCVARNDLLFTMSDNTRAGALWGSRRANLFFLTDEIAIDRIAVLVEPDGIEPTTSCLQSRRSPN